MVVWDGFPFTLYKNHPKDPNSFQGVVWHRGPSKTEWRGAIETHPAHSEGPGCPGPLRAANLILQKCIALTTDHCPAHRPGCQTEDSVATAKSDIKLKVSTCCKSKISRTAFRHLLCDGVNLTRAGIPRLPTTFRRFPDVSDGFPTIPTDSRRF